MNVRRPFPYCNLIFSTVCCLVIGFCPSGAAAQKLDLLKRLATLSHRASAPASAAAPLEARPDSASAQYRFLTLSMPGAAIFADAVGINDEGVIVGAWSDSGLNFHGALWRDQVFQQLDDPNFADTGLSGINDAGIVAGGVGSSLTFGNAVLYDIRRDNWILLPSFQGVPNNGAAAINNAGIVTGAGCGTNILNCVGWTWDGHQYSAFTVPGSDAAFGGTTPSGINDKDQIVGSYDDSNGVAHGFLKDGDRYASLDVPGATFTTAFGINDRSDIVGTYVSALDGNLHGFFLRQGQFATIDVPGVSNTLVFYINARGDIVGSFIDTTGVERPFVAYRQDE